MHLRLLIKPRRKLTVEEIQYPALPLNTQHPPMSQESRGVIAAARRQAVQTRMSSVTRETLLEFLSAEEGRSVRPTAEAENQYAFLLLKIRNKVMVTICRSNVMLQLRR